MVSAANHLAAAGNHGVLGTSGARTWQTEAARCRGAWLGARSCPLCVARPRYLHGTVHTFEAGRPMARLPIAVRSERVRTLLCHTFCTETYQIVEAADSEHALAALAQAHPDVAILDATLIWHRDLIDQDAALGGLAPGIIVLWPGPHGDSVPLTSVDYIFTWPFSPLKLLDAVDTLARRQART